MLKGSSQVPLYDFAVLLIFSSQLSPLKSYNIEQVCLASSDCNSAFQALCSITNTERDFKHWQTTPWPDQNAKKTWCILLGKLHHAAHLCQKGEAGVLFALEQCTMQ